MKLSDYPIEDLLDHASKALRNVRERAGVSTQTLLWEMRKRLDNLNKRPLRAMKTLILTILLLLAAPIHAANLTLEWDANTDEIAGYSLEMATGDGPFVWHSSSLVSPTPSAAVQNLPAGRYRFQVRAVSAQGVQSEPSNVLEVIVPATPQNLRLRMAAVQASTDMQTWETVALVSLPELPGPRAFYQLAFAKE